MNTQALPKAVKVDSPSMLPYAAYLTLFTKTRAFYNGRLLRSLIGTTPMGRAIRCVDVGDYRYIEQDNLSSNSEWALMARKGHHILWVVHRPTGKVVGKVVDGTTTRL